MESYTERGGGTRRTIPRPNSDDINELGFLIGANDDGLSHLINNNNNINDNNNNLIEETKNNQFSLFKNKPKSQSSASEEPISYETGIKRLKQANEENFESIHDFSVFEITDESKAMCKLCKALGVKSAWTTEGVGAKIYGKMVFVKHSLSVTHNPFIKCCKKACSINGLDYTTLGAASYFVHAYGWSLRTAIKRCIVDPRNIIIDQMKKQNNSNAQINVPSLIDILESNSCNNEIKLDIEISNSDQKQGGYIFNEKIEIKNKIDLVNTLIQNDISNRHFETLHSFMQRCDDRRKIINNSNKNGSMKTFYAMRDKISEYSKKKKNEWFKNKAVSYNLIIDNNTTNGSAVCTIKMRGIDAYFNWKRVLGEMADLRKDTDEFTFEDRLTYQSTEDLLQIIKNYLDSNGFDAYKIHGITIDGAERSLARALQKEYNEHALVIWGLMHKYQLICKNGLGKQNSTYDEMVSNGRALYNLINNSNIEKQVHKLFCDQINIDMKQYNVCKDIRYVSFYTQNRSIMHNYPALLLYLRDRLKEVSQTNLSNTSNNESLIDKNAPKTKKIDTKYANIHNLKTYYCDLKIIILHYLFGDIISMLKQKLQSLANVSLLTGVELLGDWYDTIDELRTNSMEHPTFQHLRDFKNKLFKYYPRNYTSQTTNHTYSSNTIEIGINGHVCMAFENIDFKKLNEEIINENNYALDCIDQTSKQYLETSNMKLFRNFVIFCPSFYETEDYLSLPTLGQREIRAIADYFGTGEEWALIHKINLIDEFQRIKGPLHRTANDAEFQQQCQGLTKDQKNCFFWHKLSIKKRFLEKFANVFAIARLAVGNDATINPCETFHGWRSRVRGNALRNRLLVKNEQKMAEINSNIGNILKEESIDIIAELYLNEKNEKKEKNKKNVTQKRHRNENKTIDERMIKKRRLNGKREIDSSDDSNV